MMRKRTSAPSAGMAALSSGQSILALEKRIAFDGAAGATAAKALKHAVDASRPTELLHDSYHDTAARLVAAPHGDVTGAVLGKSLSRETLRDAPAAQPTSVVFIESDVPDVKTLIKDIDPSARIVMLDASKDGVDAITTYLAAHQGIQNVYIFSHGSDAHLSLGTADLDSASMQGRYAADLATIKSSLGADANILVYGCDFAQSSDGDGAAHLLSRLTGASVAASTNLTGNTARGGDFVLEDRIGAITAPDILSLHIAEDYDGLLAASNTGSFTVTTGTDGSATSGTTVATATTADGAIKIVVTVTPKSSNSAGSITTKASGATFDSTAPASSYQTTLNGTAALEETLQFGGTAGGTDGTNSATITIAYYDAATGAAITVLNPIINIDRVGGSAQNSSNQAVSDSSDLTLTTAGASLTRLSGSSSAFTVTSADIYNTPNTVLASGYTADASGDPTKGTAAGAVQVVGSYSTVTFNWAKQSSSLNGGDRIDFIFSGGDTPITQNGSLPNKSYTDGQSGVSIGTSQAFSNSSGLSTTFSATGLPAGLAIDPSSGVISGTIDHDASKHGASTSGAGASLDGTYNVVVTAKNTAGNSAQQAFTIDSTNQAPVVGTKTANQTNNDGDTIASVDASQAFSDPNGDPLTYSASNLPPGLSISSAGLITGTLAKNAAPGTYSVSVTGTDDKGAATSETFDWVVKDVPPTTSGTLANQSYSDGQASVSIATSQGFSDSNGNALTYSATGLPAGLTIDATSGKITGTIDHDASKDAPSTTGSGATLDGKYSVVVTADDGLGGKATQGFTIDSTNQAPVVGTATATQNNSYGDTITPVDTRKAFSDPNGDSLTYTASGLPTGLSISSAGLITGTVSNTATVGIKPVTVTASDDKGATTTETFNWGISGTPVTIFANSGTGLYHSNLEFLTYANTTLATNGITNGATATYKTAEGGTVTVTFSNVSNAADEASFRPAAFSAYAASKFYTGYNNTASTSEILYGAYNDTSSFTVSFTATDKNGKAYTPNIAFADGETTDASKEAFTVTTNGGNFQNVETVGSAGYSLTGVGTQSITLQNDAGGVPLLVTDGASSLNITTTIAGGKQGFALALIVPTLTLDANNSSGATGANYVTTFTEKGAAVAISDTDTVATEPGVATASSARIVLTNAQVGDSLAVGTLPAGLSGTVDTSVAGQITIDLIGTASRASYQSAIHAITFSNSSADPSSADRTLNVSYNDGQLDSNTAIATIHVVAVNDAPVEVVPGPQTTNKDTALAITGLSVSDVDANGGSETVTLSTSKGTISLASTTGLTFSKGTSANDTTETFTGTLSAINNAISTVTYNPATGFSGSDTLSFSTNDNGNTGSGGAQTASQSVAITVKNVNPTANGSIANARYNDGQTGVFIATSQAFSDSLGLALTYSATGLPKGLTIDATTGKITGTIEHDASLNAPTKAGSGATLDGTYTIVETASDGQGGSTTQTFTIDSSNQAPMVGTKTAPQTNFDGDTIQAVDASKAFGDPNGDPLTYTASYLPPGLAISSAGLVTGTIAKAATPGTYAVVVTGTDDKGAATTETFNWVVRDVPPTANGTLAAQTYGDGQSGIAIATSQGFADSNGNPLTYSATGLPKGLTIDATTGKITGTIDHDASKNAPSTTGSGATLDGQYSVVVTANDGLGGTATQTFTIDATNQAPTLGTKTADQSTSDGDTIAAVDASKAFSDGNGDPLTYTASNLPAGLSISGAGLITGTVVSNAMPGTYPVSITATDDKGATTTEIFNWVISNKPPASNGTLANQTYTDGQAGVSMATAQAFSDPNGNALTYSATGLPKGLAIDAATGKITGAIDHDASRNAPAKIGSGATLDGTYTVVVIASDSLGGSAKQSFTIDATNQAPLVGTKTANRSNFDGDKVTTVDASKAFSDPNGDSLTYTASNLPAGLTISSAGLITGSVAKDAGPGTYAVVVTATDDKGAATTETFNWVVKDVPPVPNGSLADQVYTDGQIGVSIATSQGFADSNGNALTYRATGLPKGLTIDAATGKISGTVDHDASKSAPTTTGSGATLDGTYSVVVTASDGLGGSATQGFTIDSSNQAPVTGTITANQSSSDGQTITPIDASLAFSDPNPGDVITYTASNLPPGLTIDAVTGKISGTIAGNAGPGAYAVRVVATDDKGAAARESFTWTIADVPPTVASQLPNRTYADATPGISIRTDPGFNSPNGLPLVYTATGLPAGLSIDGATGVISGALDHDASKNAPAVKGAGATLDGTYAVTVTVSDGQGGTATQMFAVDATNSPPTVVHRTADQHSADGNTASVDAAAAFVDQNTGDALVYAVTGLPPGLSIDVSTGLISGTIASNASKTAPYSVTVSVTDDKGAVSRESFMWTVENVVPVATPPLADRAAFDGAGVSYTTADGFTNPNGLPLAYTATGLPKGVTIDAATGVISGTLDHDASVLANGGAYTIAVTVDDGQGGMATNTFHLAVTNQAPMVTSATPNQTGTDGLSIATLDASTAFVDPNGDPLTFSASNLPAGLTIDPTGKITGTIGADVKPGTYTSTVSAADDKGLVTSETFVWTIGDVAPATNTSLPAGTFPDSSKISIDTATGFVSPNGLVLTYSATGLPAGVAIDPTTGKITGQLYHDASKGAPVTTGAGATLDGTYTILVTASDGQGGSATQSFTLDATNTAPALVDATPAQSGPDGAKVSVDAAAAFVDPNIGDSVIYTASGLPPGLTIDPSSGLITGTLAATASKAGPYNVTVMATDDKGAATSEQFTWQVIEVAPVATGALSDRATRDGAVVSYATASGFADPNGPPLTYAASGLPAGLTIDPNTGVISGTVDRNASTVSGGLYAITVAVNDGQGGTATSSFHLTSTNQAPVIRAPTANQTHTDGQAISPVSVAAAFADPNGDALTYAASNLPKGLSIDASGTISGTVATNATPGVYAVTIIVTDSKGVATPETFTWMIADAPPTVDAALGGRTYVDSQSGVSIATSGGFKSPNGLPLSYGATGLPAGLAIDAATGLITGTIDHDASKNAPVEHGAGATLDGTYAVTVTVSDGQGGTAQQTFAIDATNQAPTAGTVVLDQHGTAGNSAQVNTAIAFSDPNTGDVLTYSATGLPTGLVIDGATGLITGTIDSTAGSASPYAVAVTATDDKGAAVTKTIAWTVDAPGTGPTPIPNYSLYDGATSVSIATASHFSNPNNAPLVYSAIGLPSGLTIDAATGQITGALSHDASKNGAGPTGSGATLDGTYSVTITVLDPTLPATPTSRTFVIDVANQAPVVGTKTADQTTTSGTAIATVDTSLAFSDPNGDTLTYAVAGLPSGLSFDTSTGKITGTTAVGSAGTYAVTVTATDDKGAETSELFAWTVNDSAPAIAGMLAAKSYADSTGGISIDAGAAFSSPNGLTLIYAATGLPAGLSIDAATGLITGMLVHDASKNAPVTRGSAGTLDGTYVVTVTASDGHVGSTAQTFTIDATNQAPVAAAGAQTADQHGADGSTASVDAASAFRDPNFGDGLTYSATGLPPGLAIDAATGLISGTIDKGASRGGPYSVIVSAIDDKGAATSETFTYTVGAVPPLVVPLGDVSAYDASIVSIPTVTGFTNPDNQALTYSATGLPSGLTIDPATGLIGGTLSRGASTTAGGIYAIAVTADDGQGGVAVNTFHVVATNQTPVVVAGTADQISSDGQVITPLDASQAFHDPNGDPVTYSASNLPKGLAIDPATGVISGTVSATAATATGLVTVTATDDKGAAESETFLWTVNDTAPAKIGVVAAQSFADSAAGIAIATANTFTNPMGLTYAYSATGLPAGLTIDPRTGLISGQLGHDASANAPITSGTGAALDGTYTVVVSAYDGHGGTSTQVFTIDATNSAPILAAQTSAPLGYNGRMASLDAGSAFRDPNTGDGLTFDAAGLPAGLAIDSATGLITGTIDKTASAHGPYNVTVTATDDKGAATTETFVWTIDNIAPVATPPLADLAAYDRATLRLTTANGFTNPNALAFVYTATGLPVGLAIDAATGVISGTLDHDASALVANGRYTIAVTANDGLGGSAVNTFILTATNQAPVVAAVTPDQLVNNGQVVEPIDASTVFKDPNGDPLTYAAYDLPSGLAIDPTSGRISGTVGGEVVPGAYEVTVLATDDKGAVSSETFRYVVDDNPPVKTGTLANQMYADSTGNVAIPTADGFTSPNGDPLTFTASGLPRGLTIDPTTGLISGFIAHDSSKNAPVTTGFGATLEGIYTVTVTASDGLGGFATQAFMIEATNQAPTLGTPTAAQANADRDAISLDASRAFADPNIGDVLTYAASGLPKGLTIDPASGVITGTIDPAASASGPYTVSVTATDDKSAATIETFTWTVADLAPTATSSPASVTGADGAAIAPIDPASHIANQNGLPLTYSVTGLPAGLSIDPETGLITGTLDHDASKNAPVTVGSGATLDGTYTIVVSASDGQGGVATEIFTFDATNNAPVVATATAAQSSTDGDRIALDASKAFGDPNVGDVLAFAAAGLPKGLAIDPASGLISGTIDPAASASGPYNVSVTATDDKGAAVIETFTWTVADLAPTATSSPAPAGVADGAAIAPIDTASHIANPNSRPLTYAATGLPAGLTIDPNTGLITGTIDHDASKNAPMTSGSGATLDGTYTIVVTISDGQGGTATESFTLDSKNGAPVIGAQTAEQSSTGGDSVAVDASKTFGDPNVGDALTYVATGLPQGLAIDPKSGLISGTIDPAAFGPYTVVVTAIDDKGAAVHETFTWTVADLAPTATSSPAAARGADGAAVAPIDTASHIVDPNGQPLVYGATGLPAGLTIDPVTGLISGTLDHDASKNAPVTTGAGATLDGTYTIVVTATDSRGGVATETFTLDATNQAPVVGTPTGDQSNAAGAPVSVDTHVVDPNGDPLTFAATGLPPGVSIDPATGHIAGTIAPTADVGPYDVTVFATDDKGAVVTETFIWTVSDVAPVATAAIPDVIASEGRPLAPLDTAAHFADANGLPLTYGATGLPLGLTIDPATGLIAGTLDHEASRHGPYTVVVSADDGRGGIATQTFTLDAVNDAPVVGAPTTDQTARAGHSVPTLETGSAFSDPNGDTLTFSAKGLPPGLTIDPATGLITGTVAISAARGGYSVTVSATDDKGATASETFDWYVDAVTPNILDQPSFVPFVTPPVPARDIAHDRPGGTDLHADGAVLDAVNAISGDQEQSLVIRADEIVVSTVNNVRPLNGLQDLNAPGAGIVRAGAAANERGDRYVRAASGSSLGTSLFEKTGPDEVLGSSLRDSSILRGDAGATINIETLIHDRVLTIALDNLSTTACVVPVASYSVTRADGSPLPAWLHAQAKNVLVGKIPSGVEAIDLKIEATLANGIVSERRVTIGTNSGTIRPVGAPARHEGRLLSDMVAARTLPVGRGLGHLLD